MNRFQIFSQTEIDGDLFRRWLTKYGCIVQALSTLPPQLNCKVRGKFAAASMKSRNSRLTKFASSPAHCASYDNECNVPTITIRLGYRVQHRPLRKLDVPAVNADEDPPEEWEAGRCQKVTIGSTRSQNCFWEIFLKLSDVGHSTKGIETTKAKVTFKVWSTYPLEI